MFTCAKHQGFESPVRVRHGFGERRVVPKYPRLRSLLLLIHLRIDDLVVLTVALRFDWRLACRQSRLDLGMGRR